MHYTHPPLCQHYCLLSKLPWLFSPTYSSRIYWKCQHLPTLHLVPSRKIPTCSTSSVNSNVSNLMLMDRGLVSDMQCVKAELGQAESPTGTCVVPGAGCQVREPSWRWVVRKVWDSVRADSPESREMDSVAQHSGNEPALLKAALGWSRVLATRPAGQGLAPHRHLSW